MDEVKQYYETEYMYRIWGQVLAGAGRDIYEQKCKLVSYKPVQNMLHVLKLHFAQSSRSACLWTKLCGCQEISKHAISTFLQSAASYFYVKTSESVQFRLLALRLVLHFGICNNMIFWWLSKILGRYNIHSTAYSSFNSHWLDARDQTKFSAAWDLFEFGAFIDPSDQNQLYHTP